MSDNKKSNRLTPFFDKINLLYQKYSNLLSLEEDITKTKEELLEIIKNLMQIVDNITKIKNKIILTVRGDLLTIKKKLEEELIEELEKEELTQKYSNIASHDDMLNRIKKVLFDTIWIMFNLTKYYPYMEDLIVEIFENTDKCLSSYPNYKKNQEVPFSKFLYHHFECYVFTPYKQKIDYSIENYSDFSLSEYVKNLLNKLNKYIERYQQLRYKKPDFNKKEVKSWFCSEMKISEKTLKQLIEIKYIKKESINPVTNDSDEEKEIDPKDDKQQYEDACNFKEMLQIEVEAIQKYWENIKKVEKRNQISALFTYFFLEKVNFPPEFSDTKQGFMSQYEIFNNFVSKNYFSGKYYDSFSQKNIADELGLKEDNACKILKRFLSKLKDFFDIDS